MVLFIIQTSCCVHYVIIGTLKKMGYGVLWCRTTIVSNNTDRGNRCVFLRQVSSWKTCGRWGGGQGGGAWGGQEAGSNPVVGYVRGRHAFLVVPRAAAAARALHNAGRIGRIACAQRGAGAGEWPLHKMRQVAGAPAGGAGHSLSLSSEKVHWALQWRHCAQHYAQAIAIIRSASWMRTSVRCSLAHYAMLAAGRWNNTC